MSSIRRALADRISFRRYRYLAENRRRLGSRLYKAKLNAENPVDTVQSIEYALRGLDKAVAEEQERAARAGITAPGTAVLDSGTMLARRSRLSRAVRRADICGPETNARSAQGTTTSGFVLQRGPRPGLSNSGRFVDFLCDEQDGACGHIQGIECDVTRYLL